MKKVCSVLLISVLMILSALAVTAKDCECDTVVTNIAIPSDLISKRH